MAEERGRPPGGPGGDRGHKTGGFLGSLKEALAAAGRDDTTAAKGDGKPEAAKPVLALPPAGGNAGEPGPSERKGQAAPSAAEAARDAKVTAPLSDFRDRYAEPDAPPTTRVVRAAAAREPREPQAPARTQLVRGKQEIKRGQFHQDPVVGWLVVVGGSGLGAFRPIFEGNNTIGRSPDQRVPIDFGDMSISSEEQAFIRYDSIERSFLFVPNLAKTNVVSINNKRPTAAVELSAMDLITMGRTQLVFVPFCGADFDWAELSDSKGLLG